MEITLRIEVNDGIFIKGVRPPEEADYQKAIEKIFKDALDQRVNEARNITSQNTPAALADLATKMGPQIEEFEGAQDALAQAIHAYKLLIEPGVKVRLNQDSPQHRGS